VEGRIALIAAARRARARVRRNVSAAKGSLTPSRLNQLINVAIAEKVSALRTDEYFAERAPKGDIRKALRVFRRAGKGKPPVPGDELPSKRTRRGR
jgi:hypothetical protein